MNILQIIHTQRRRITEIRSHFISIYGIFNERLYNGASIIESQGIFDGKRDGKVKIGALMGENPFIKGAGFLLN